MAPPASPFRFWHLGRWLVVGALAVAAGGVGAPGCGGGKSAKCCPRDPMISGCVNLGGQKLGASCEKACDFYCATNWRVEQDTLGCEVWRYDVRQPVAGEDRLCRATSGGAAGDGGGGAGGADAPTGGAAGR